ncbi:MAG: arginine deiminase family protein, partial [Myxococcota bacterium]
MVSVHSEIGRLRQVLLHEPGKEVDQMIPEMMEELLFDDILYGDQAREEHGRFRRILQLLGVEIFESQQLLSETLQFDEARAWLWPRLVEHVEPDFEGLWNELPPKELAEALVGGYRRPRTDPTRMTKHDLFSITPLPNWCFQRDPQVVMYEGVMFGAMCSPARQRETLYSQAIFRFHPMLRETPIFFDPAEATDRSHLLLRLQQPELEGGDFLVLSEDILLVGCSQRTNDVAIHYLANELACKEHGPRWMFVVDLPKKRAYMHLDTLMTPVDHDTALVYPPVILS